MGVKLRLNNLWIVPTLTIGVVAAGLFFSPLAYKHQLIHASRIIVPNGADGHAEFDGRAQVYFARHRLTGASRVDLVLLMAENANVKGDLRINVQPLNECFYEIAKADDGYDLKFSDTVEGWRDEDILSIPCRGAAADVSNERRGEIMTEAFEFDNVELMCMERIKYEEVIAFLNDPQVREWSTTVFSEWRERRHP